MRTISENRCFDGVQGVYAHPSEACGGEMTFGLFLPREAADGPVPVLWYLSGLTCTHENAMTKAGAQGWAAEQGIALVFPDTSPRGDDVADDEAYDLGQGAGFYIDATEVPWAPLQGRIVRGVVHVDPQLALELATRDIEVTFAKEVAGFLVGSEFPLASREVALRSEVGSSIVGGRFYALDLAGAWLGTLLVSVLLVPLVGISNTLLFVAALKACSLFLLYRS